MNPLEKQSNDANKTLAEPGLSDHEKKSQWSAIQGDIWNCKRDKGLSDNESLKDFIDRSLYKYNHNIIVNALIDEGGYASFYVIYHLEEFKGLDYTAIANKLIDEGGGEFFAAHIDKFKDLDYEDIADKLIKLNLVGCVTGYLGAYHGLDQAALVERLIKSRYAKYVANDIEKFQDLDRAAIANKLLDSGWTWCVADNLEKFEGLDHLAIAIKLIDEGNEETLAENLEKFQGLDYSVIANKLIEKGKGEYVAKYLEKFQGVNHSDIAKKIIETGSVYYFLSNFKKFHGLNHPDIAKKFINMGLIQDFFDNFEEFYGLDHNAVANQLIDVGRPDIFIKKIEKFQGLDINVANKLIDKGYANSVAENLAKFKSLDADVADKLIQAGQGSFVASSLGRFENLNHTEAANKIIDAGQGYSVATNLKIFKGLNHVEIVNKLIDAHQAIAITANLEKFEGLNHIEIANRLIDIDEAKAVAIQISKFYNLNTQVANKLVDAHESHSVACFLSRFDGLNHLEIATRMFDKGQGDAVAASLKNFQGLDEDIASRLININRTREVVENIASFKGLNEEIATKLIKSGNYQVVDSNPEYFSLSENIQNIISSKHLTVSEAVILNEQEATKLSNEQANKPIVNVLIEKEHPAWQDKENVLNPFQEGASIFGEDKMFQYLDRIGLSRHDGLHQFAKIIDLFRTSGLSANEFYNNILMQVASDDGEYYSGTAHHQFNSLATSISLDFNETKELVNKYQDVSKLQVLFRELNSLKEIFASWKNLKKFKEVQELLEKTEILDRLVELKKYPDKQKLKDYVETLAFHPAISMEKVMLFWQNPEKFLGLADSHTPEEVHDRKKPSNYTNFPNLDLSASNLRDALVNGAYDQIQSFKPFSVEYTLSDGKKSEEGIISLMNRALGKRSENIKGQAKNPPKVFKELSKFISKEELTLVLSGNLSLSEDDEKNIKQIIFNEDIGLMQPKTNREVYRAKVNKKSDPDAVVAGNDTACCMPFGSGKNNVYTFNPNCALFTLQKKVDNKVWRTIAQSVLTEDVKVNKNVSDIVDQIENNNKKLNTVISEDILLQEKSFIACDNIEVAENFKNKQEEIKLIYQDFFKEYLKQFASLDNLEDSKVVIGKGYTDALTDLPSENNEFVPRAPVGYSDKLGEEVYVLDLNKDFRNTSQIASKKIIDQELLTTKVKPDYLPKGVDYLTFKDALPVAYIEGKAYAQNESLIQYLHNMENALIAKDVNDAAKNRPNMSLKYIGDDKKIHGYILAYEGQSDETGEGVVYVSDLASDGNARAGGSLILGFTESYKHNYLDQNKLHPIYAQMREKTSYAIIQKQLEKLSKGTNIKFEIEELEVYRVGNDTMHEVMIRAKKE
ncbi:MAG: hypothetical protein NTY12_02300 [Candidatus Falkowbacteria bacterium]|nr:hypothetical protein [Candidatus Falkowbacteria bacterium]